MRAAVPRQCSIYNEMLNFPAVRGECHGLSLMWLSRISLLWDCVPFSRRSGSCLLFPPFPFSEPSCDIMYPAVLRQKRFSGRSRHAGREVRERGGTPIHSRELLSQKWLGRHVSVISWGQFESEEDETERNNLTGSEEEEDERHLS